MKMLSSGQALDALIPVDCVSSTELSGKVHSRQETLMGDAEIRPALRERLNLLIGNDEDTAIIEELGICRGQVRVDLAVVNGTIHGYEIKSERDSLRRLAGQAALYNRVFDQVSLVVADRHIPEALDIVPVWWEILMFKPTDKGIRFTTARRARKNPGRDSRSLVEFLWLDDAIALLEKHKASRGVRGKPRRLVWDRVCEIIPVNEIGDAVRASLKARAMQPEPVSLS